MNKSFSILILALMLISTMGMVSAISTGTTFIGGNIYNADYSDKIAGAEVIVTCDGTDLSTTSFSDGSYGVTYSIGDCNVGSALSVFATKEGLYGSKSGVIHAINSEFDFAIVNVPLVPEFGVFLGALTVLSAVGIFFFVRRK